MNANEVQDLLESVEAASRYLSPASRAYLSEYSPIVDTNGNLSVACIEDKECVFVYFEGGTARCAVERAWVNGDSSFRKPISCHLFPIRVADFGGAYMYYDIIEECNPGRALGEQTQHPLAASVADAVERFFGPTLGEFFRSGGRL